MKTNLNLKKLDIKYILCAENAQLSDHLQYNNKNVNTLLPVLSTDFFYCQTPNLQILYAPKHIFNFKLLYHETTNRFFLFLSRKSGGKKIRFLPRKCQQVGQNTEAFLPSEYPQSSERALCFGSLASQINIRKSFCNHVMS